VIENRPGAGSSVAVSEVARARPDGHTLMFINPSGFAIQPQVAARPSYDPLNDLAPIAMVANTPVTVVAGPGFTGGDVRGLIAAMRKGEVIRAVLSQNPNFRALAQKNPAQVNATLARVRALQADALGPIQREMLTASRQAAINAYAREFTAAELNAILAFYKSPAGAKLLARQGAINAEVGRAMQAKFGPRVAAAEKAVGPRIDAELRGLGPQQAPAK
jgi:hypothetical protein